MNANAEKIRNLRIHLRWASVPGDTLNSAVPRIQQELRQLEAGTYADPAMRDDAEVDQWLSQARQRLGIREDEIRCGRKLKTLQEIEAQIQAEYGQPSSADDTWRAQAQRRLDANG